VRINMLFMRFSWRLSDGGTHYALPHLNEC
jgi:hypothetical protein